MADRTRTGTAGLTTPGAVRYTTATTKTGTTGLEPAASRLTSECSARLSYAPREGLAPATAETFRRARASPTPCQPCAGGIRTHGLELMRLARTAAPLPRCEQVWLAGVEPAVSGARSRRGGLLPYSQKTNSSTPGGIRTRSFRVESPASSPLRPRGQLSSGGRTRTCASRVNSRASHRLDHAGTKSGGSRIRTCGRLAAYAVATRCLAGSAMPPRGGRRGSRTPKAREAHPFSRRDTAPVAVLPAVAPAGVEPAPSRLRGGSSAD